MTSCLMSLPRQLLLLLQHPEGSIWIDSDSTDLDFYLLTNGSWSDTGINLKGLTGPTVGAQGPTGATGSTGATGAQGPKGDKGDTWKHWCYWPG